LQRNTVLERLTMILRQRIDPFEHDAFGSDRLPFIDLHDDVDGILILAQLDVERRDTRIGKAPILIERDAALVVGFDLRAFEVVVVARRQLRARGSGDDTLELLVVNRVDAVQFEPVDLYASLLFASRWRDEYDGGH